MPAPRTGYVRCVWLPLLPACVQVIPLEDPPPAATAEEACARGNIRSVPLDVSFPERAPGCAWGEDGNRSPDQGVVTARAEQSAALALDGAICGLDFDFSVDRGDADAAADDEPLLRYDDGFLLTFDDVILVASYAPLVEVFATDGLLRVYDWSRLVGFPFGFEPEGTYCLGEVEGLSSCEVPPPETAGPLSLVFGDPIVAALAERAHARGGSAFGFVTYGDNDPDFDCSHSAFSFRVDARIAPY